MFQRADHRTARGAWGDGVRLGLALVWLLGVLSCPDRVAGAFAGAGAALFAGAFVLGAFVCCCLRFVSAARRWCADPGEKVSPGASRLFAATPFVLFAAVVALELWLVAFGPVPVPLAVLDGFVAGAGEGAALLAAAPRFFARTPTDALRGVGAASCTAALLLCPLVAMGAGTTPGLVWGYLALAALATGIACLPGRGRLALASSAAAVATPGRSEGIDESRGLRASSCAAAVLKDGLWEPALGFGLSLMSTLLPWGAYFAGGPASTPPAWAFAAGMAVAGCCLTAAGRTRLAEVPFGVAVHVAMPMLAAAVVALRMLGDVGSSDIALASVKGVASGITAVGFAAFAWLAMGHAAHVRGAGVLPYAVGLALAFAVGSVILPLHGLNQSVASLTAPVLSLVFLVVTSCSSLGHLGHRGETEGVGGGGGPLSVEEAAARVAVERGLSPRETEVLVRLASGRSAEGGIAEVLGISPNTVRAHVRSIHEKLQVSSRDQVVDAIEAARKRD